jgi:serine protease Do
MFDNVSWRKIGLAVTVSLVAVGAVGAVVVAQTRRSPLVELRSLVRSGPELGVSVRDVTDADAKTAGLASPAGAHVESVATESAAAKAGVQTGDVIVSFDGERVRSAAHLVRLVGETPAGRTVEIALQRAGKRVTVNAALAEPGRAGTPGALLAPNLRSEMLRDFDFNFNFDGAGPRSLIGAGRLGVTAETMSDQLREHFGAANGVLVTNGQ